MTARTTDDLIAALAERSVAVFGDAVPESYRRLQGKLVHILDAIEESRGKEREPGEFDRLCETAYEWCDDTRLRILKRADSPEGEGEEEEKQEEGEEEGEEEEGEEEEEEEEAAAEAAKSSNLKGERPGSPINRRRSRRSRRKKRSVNDINFAM